MSLSMRLAQCTNITMFGEYASLIVLATTVLCVLAFAAEASRP
jgi:hypothetical protein